MLRVKQYSNMKESRPYTLKTSKGRESNERRNLLTRMFLLIGGLTQLGYEDYNSIRAKMCTQKKTYICTVLILCMVQFDKTR